MNKWQVKCRQFFRTRPIVDYENNPVFGTIVIPAVVCASELLVWTLFILYSIKIMRSRRLVTMTMFTCYKYDNNY